MHNFNDKVAIITGDICIVYHANSVQLHCIYIFLKHSSSNSLTILGASSGIGAATAVHFASLGCSLSLTGRNVDNLERTK
jgi:hypothetical protein